MIKKFFVFVIVLSIFVIPAFVFAISTTSSYSSYSNYSEEELIALIAKLQKQLEEVRKNQIQCVLADVDLSIGDGEGDVLKENVKSLQNFLKEKGYFAYSATGYFGKLTRTALMNFQKDNGLEQTGELNSSLREKIKNLKCKKNYISYKTEYKKVVDKEIVSTGEVKSISLIGDGKLVKWSTSGYSKSGYKIVWSKNTGPIYPTRDGDKYIYLSEPGAYTTNLDAFNGSGVYFVRVCEYLGGSCGVYSNEIKVSL